MLCRNTGFYVEWQLACSATSLQLTCASMLRNLADKLYGRPEAAVEKAVRASSTECTHIREHWSLPLRVHIPAGAFTPALEAQRHCCSLLQRTGKLSASRFLHDIASAHYLQDLDWSLARYNKYPEHHAPWVCLAREALPADSWLVLLTMLSSTCTTGGTISANLQMMALARPVPCCHPEFKQALRSLCRQGFLKAGPACQLDPQRTMSSAPMRCPRCRTGDPSAACCCSMLPAWPRSATPASATTGSSEDSKLCRWHVFRMCMGVPC